MQFLITMVIMMNMDNLKPFLFLGQKKFQLNTKIFYGMILM